MKKTLTIVLAAAAAALPAAAQAQLPQGHKFQGGHVPGELIVKFKPGVDAGKRTAVLHARGAAFKRSLPLARTVVSRVPAGTELQNTVRALERDPRVEWAQPNAYMEGASVPNDPFFGDLWGLSNSGQPVYDKSGTPGSDIHAPAAWDKTTGSPDVKVAVVDSGVNFRQPDLAPNGWHNPGETGGGREQNGVDDDGNGYVDDWRGWDFVSEDNDPDDRYGHGTHVAGTIAARGNNGVGVAGVAWSASMIPVRVLDNLNHGSCADGAAGLAYAARAGARVVNLSVQMFEPCQAMRDVIESAPKTLFVVSAGNDAEDVDSASDAYPCIYPSANIVCVAATNPADGLATFSNYGSTSVDLAAPGVGILSSSLKWFDGETLFGDGFESPIGSRWVTGGSPDTWDRSPFTPLRSGGFSLSNSTFGSYPNNADSWARLVEGVDLRNQNDCAAVVWVDVDLGPGERDLLHVETSTDGAHWVDNDTVAWGTTNGFVQWVIDISKLEGRSSGGLRFRLVSDGSDTYGGVALDDLTIECFPVQTSYSGARDEFETHDGTSMAAPHVAGVAVLLLALDSQMTPAELKERLLNGTDPAPGLAGKTVTGGRLNAAKTVNLPLPVRQGPAAPPAGNASRRSAIAAALAGDLKAIAKALKSFRIRKLLRKGKIGPLRVRALERGRFTLKLKSASGKTTIAQGACTAKRAGRCSLTAKLTRRGRSVLRRARRRLKVTLELKFAPRSGSSVVRRTTLTLTR